MLFAKLNDLSIGGKGSYGIAASAVERKADLPTYLRITDIFDDGTLNLSELKSVDAPNSDKYILKPNDIVFARTGGSTGRNYFYDGSDGVFVYAGFLIKFSIDPEKVNPKYVKYYCRSKQYNDWVQSFNTGSTRGNINAQTFGNMEIPLPERKQQDYLVSILEPIDEKIKNNKQVNDNLQQQLFSLYENMATASPCLKEYTLSNLCDFQEGYVNPPQTHPEYFDGEVKWLRAVDINESFIIETSRTLTKAGFESAKKSALLFEPNTIAISKSGTIGRLGIIADYMCGNRAVINIAPHDTNMLAFIYCFLKSKQREFPDMAVGSVQKNLYVSLLEPLSVSIPDNESLTAFNAVGASILGMIHNNCVENTDLANLRDTILPKLMSGEIDVSSVLL